MSTLCSPELLPTLLIPDDSFVCAGNKGCNVKGFSYYVPQLGVLHLEIELSLKFQGVIHTAHPRLGELERIQDLWLIQLNLPGSSS